MNLIAEERKLGDTVTFEPATSFLFEGAWYTGSITPGSYKTIISVFDTAGQLLSRKELGFIIEETWHTKPLRNYVHNLQLQILRTILVPSE